MNFRSAVVAAACLVAFVPFTASTANAAAPPHLGEGRPLAPRLEPDPAVRILTASAKYYIADYGYPNDHVAADWDIMTTGNGAVVGNYRRIQSQTDRVPQLVGSYAVEYEFGGTYAVVRSVGSLTLKQYDAPTGATVHGVGPAVLLLSRPTGVALRTFAGTERPIEGPATDAWIVDQNATELLIGSGNGLHVVDIATGTATKIDDARPTVAALTPGRVIWQTGETATTTQLAWRDRTGSGQGAVDIPFRLPWMPIGDDVAVRDPESKDLVRIAVDGGAVTRPLVTDVHSAADLGDGTLLVSAQSQVAKVGADGVLHTVKATPPFQGQIRHVALSGDRVVTTKNLPTADEPSGFMNGHPVYETRDGGAHWTDLQTLETSQIPPQLAGDTLMTSVLDQDTGATTATLTDATGTMTFTGPDIVLGGGGRLVGRPDRSSGEVAVYDLSDRTEAGRYDAPVALDGATVWTGPDANSVLTGHVRDGSTVTTEAAAGCGGLKSFRAAGRWLVLDCEGPDQVVDTTGTVPPRTVVLGADWKLGTGFVVQTTSGTDANGVATKELLVTDLNAADLQQRRYGPILGKWQQPASFAPDGSGAARIAYADPDARPRVITLDWLADEPAAGGDYTPPVLATASAGPRLNPTTALTFSWSFTDPTVTGSPTSGVKSYDVRYQQRAGGTTSYGAWVERPALQVKQLSLTAASGTDTCFQVRARDNNGNVSLWSASYCSEVDGKAPVLLTTSAGGRVTVAPTNLFEYRFTDNVKVTSYDVVYRDALVGKGPSSWVYPAAWQKTTATSMAWTPVAGVDRCFMVRARDAVGNLSAWSAPTCSASPQDDRALAASGTFVRTTSTITYRKTITSLRAAGTRLSKTGEAGLQIALLTVDGPGQGAVDVYHAGVKVGRVSLLASRSTLQVHYLPVTAFRTGEIRVVSVGSAPVVIDGVALLRS